jgi:phosphomannomutase
MSQEITLDRLQKLIKAYDVRGIVPGELDENISFQIGQAFVVALKLRKSEGGCGQVVIAHDMRPSGPALVQSFANGIKAQGVDVLHMGLASTDGLYFATGFLNIAGAMFTASHNPAQYNGIKLAKAGAAPVGQDSGLKEITQLVLKGVSPYEGVKGKDSERDLNSEYVKYLHSLVDLKAVRKLKVVIDAGNGMGGFSVPKVFDNSNIEIVPMYFELSKSD